MKTRRTFLVRGLALLALPLVARAQQSGKIPRIGFLSALSHSDLSSRFEAFREGLRELGYAEGKNILVEYRYAEGKFDRLPGLAAELVRLKVDLIVCAGPIATRPAKAATSTIPIVMAFDNDPVGDGFIASLARPGGNVTGLSTLAPELSGKQLELLKEIVPNLARVAVLRDPTEPGIAQLLKVAELAALALKVRLQYLEVRGLKDIGSAFRAAGKERADAILVMQSAITLSLRQQVVALAARSRLPAMYPFPEFVQDGGLVSYAVNYNDLFRRSAIYVDKILKGRAPADVPVEQPVKFDFIVNLKAAKQIGLAIPQSVLLRADKVIE